MNLFRSRNLGAAASKESGNPNEVVAKLDTALTAVFSEDGKRTVLYYMTNKYGLTLEQASLDPTRLERAFTGMLGEIGWMVVTRAILEQFWDRRIGMEEANTLQRVSLREAFSFSRIFSTGSFVSPR